MAPEKDREEEAVTRRELEKEIHQLRRDKQRLEDSVKRMEQNQQRIFGEGNRRPGGDAGEEPSKKRARKDGEDDEDKKKDGDGSDNEEKDGKKDGDKDEKDDEDGKDKKDDDKDDKKSDDDKSDKSDDPDDEKEKKDVKREPDTRPSFDKTDKTVKRARSMFGGLLGHLHSAKSRLEQEKGEKTSELRAKAEMKIGEKMDLRKTDIKEFRKQKFSEQMEENRAKAIEIAKLIEEKEQMLLQKRLENHYSLMMNFIRTKAEPTIFYLPASHNSETRAQLDETRRAIKHKISSLKGQLEPPDEEQLKKEARERMARNSAAEAAERALAAAEGAKKDDKGDADASGSDKEDGDEPKSKKQKTEDAADDKKDDADEKDDKKDDADEKDDDKSKNGDKEDDKDDDKDDDKKEKSDDDKEKSDD